MSAFIVNKEHIDALVRLAVVHDVHWYDGTAYHQPRLEQDITGLMLLQENIKSVQYRYSGDALNRLPGPINAYWTKPYSYSPMGRVPTPVEGLKLIDCFEYQSCEHPGWQDSAAKRFCTGLSQYLIHALPGYDEAPWEWGGR